MLQNRLKEKVEKIRYFILILFSFLFSNIYGQSQLYYKKIKSNNQQSINYSKKLLGDLRESNQNKLDQLYLIKNQIDKRKSTIFVINSELRLISEQVNRDNEKLQNLYFQLEEQKSEYAKLIYYSYLNKSVQDRMIYLLSASSFASVYKRIIYLKQLTDYRKDKYIRISHSIVAIDSSITVLSNLKDEKKDLYNEKIEERDSLLYIRKKLNITINELRLEISKINEREKKEKKEKETINTNVKIEISKNLLNNENELKTKSIKFGKVTGKDFKKYKKQHLWPLKKFVIIHKFGNYSHPVLNDIVLKNDGIELGAAPNSNVYSIYKGLVVNIISIAGLGHSIIIKHGEYYSVYSQVGKIYIEKGENVSRGQRIAQLKGEKKLEKLIFQIWKGKEKLDPQKWLIRK